MDYFDWELIEIPVNKNSGEVVTTCPSCSHSRKKSKDKCLGVNLDMGVAHCNHCGAKATRDYSNMDKKEKVYKTVPWSNKTGLSNEVVKWFKERGIGQNTLLENGISYKEEYMPQTQKKVGCIQFPYFAKGECINIKFRDGKKNFKLVKDAKKILYGVDHLTGFDTAYFVEGEMDKLSFYEAGVKNVVSCPNGATISQKEKEVFDKSQEFNDQNVLNLQYLDDSIEYIDHIKKWVICTYKDAA